MATAALIVGIAAGLAAVGSLVLQFRESGRRDEELGLLRAQVDLLRVEVEANVDARLGEKRAELLCRQGSHGGAQPGIDEYDVTLHNAGRATAHDVKAWIATDAGESVSDTQRLGAIARDEESPLFKLRLSIDHSRNRPRPLFVRASWADGAGLQEENLAELVGF